EGLGSCQSRSAGKPPRHAKVFRRKVIVFLTAPSPNFTFNQPQAELKFLSPCASSARARPVSCSLTSAVTTAFKFGSGLTGFSGHSTRNKQQIGTRGQAHRSRPKTRLPHTSSTAVWSLSL